MAIDAHALVTIIIDGAPWWPEVCPCHRVFARMRGGFLFAVTPGFSGGKRILRCCCCTLRPAYTPLYALAVGIPPPPCGAQRTDGHGCEPDSHAGQHVDSDSLSDDLTDKLSLRGLCRAAWRKASTRRGRKPGRAPYLLRCSLRGRGSVRFKASTLSVDVAGRHHYHEGK